MKPSRIFPLFFLASLAMSHAEPVPVPAPGPTPVPAETAKAPMAPPAASSVVARFNAAQKEFNDWLLKVAESNPALAEARKASAELTREAMKAMGTHPELAELREKRNEAVNRLGNALKTGDRAAADVAEAEFRQIGKDMETKAATLPDLADKRAKAKTAREQFMKLRDEAVEASPEGKALKAKVEELRKVVLPPEQPASGASPGSGAVEQP